MPHKNARTACARTTDGSLYQQLSKGLTPTPVHMGKAGILVMEDDSTRGSFLVTQNCLKDKNECKMQSNM
jgi:hypothetical protein